MNKETMKTYIYGKTEEINYYVSDGKINIGEFATYKIIDDGYDTQYHEYYKTFKRTNEIDKNLKGILDFFRPSHPTMHSEPLYYYSDDVLNAGIVQSIIVEQPKINSKSEYFYKKINEVELNIPVMEDGQEFFLEEFERVVRIEKSVRTDGNAMVYYVDYVFETTEVNKEESEIELENKLKEFKLTLDSTSEYNNVKKENKKLKKENEELKSKNKSHEDFYNSVKDSFFVKVFKSNKKPLL